MEGWINIKRGWFWSQRYGFIAPGEFRYYDDAAMTKLKRTFKLKDLQIVQNRADKIIKLVQSNNELLQLKSDLHELWFTKLIQSKVSQLDIHYIPQQQAQELIRRNSQNANLQILEQQNNNPNSEVNPLDITNMNVNRNLQNQRNIVNSQQPQQRFHQEQQQFFSPIGNIYGSAQQTQQRHQQVVQQQQQILQQQQPQQIVQQRQVNPPQNNNSQPRQPQLQQQNRQQNQQVEQQRNQQVQQQQEKESKGIFSKLKDFLTGKKEDFYDENFVSHLNNNTNDKIAAKQKIEEILNPITSQSDSFNFEHQSNIIQFNFLQSVQLQDVFEVKRNILPIRIFFSLFLMIIILSNSIQWQSNQLIYTFCSMLIILFCVFYKHMKSKQIALKCHVDAFTQKHLEIKNQYTVNQLFTQLKLINKNLIIFEQEKNKDLFILDRNSLFQAVYYLNIKNAKELNIKIYTRNYEYLDSIIDNFTTNYSNKIGIWKEDNNRQAPKQIAILEIFSQKLKKYKMESHQYNEKSKDKINYKLFIAFQVIKNNWQFSYELFVLVCLLLKTRDYIENQFDWMQVSHWFLIVNYGITFTKLTFFFESLFLNLRIEVRQYEKMIDKARNHYYQKDIYTITFNNKEILIQEKISDVEVWFVCISLFASIVFRDWMRVLSVIILPVLKPSFLKRYDQLKKIIITVPSVLVLSVVGILAGIFFGAMYVIWFILKQFSSLLQFIFRGCKVRKESINVQQNQVYINFFEASQIENYQEQECCICLEGYASAKEKVFRCKNKHFYHKDCIVKWITSGNFSATRKCPICRVDLLN